MEETAVEYNLRKLDKIRYDFHYTFVRAYARRKEFLQKAKYLISILRCPTRLILLIMTILTSFALRVFILASVLEEYTRIHKAKIPFGIPEDTLKNTLAELEKTARLYKMTVDDFATYFIPITLPIGPLFIPSLDLFFEAHKQQAVVASRLVEAYKNRLT